MAGVLGRSRFQTLLCRCSCSSGGARRMSSGVDTEAGKAVRQQLEAAAREDRLDFFTAARILFSTPSKPKKFGLDFHLWQFFVALLPPFAVYLTAQYSRYEMRRMEKEREQAQQLKLQPAFAEELAAQLTDEEIKPSSTSTPQTESSKVPQEQKDDTKAKNNDEPVFMLPETDFLAMKSRLDAMELQVKLLESVQPRTTFIIPLEAVPKVHRVPTKENIEKPALQATDQAKSGEELQIHLRS